MHDPDQKSPKNEASIQYIELEGQTNNKLTSPESGTFDEISKPGQPELEVDDEFVQILKNKLELKALKTSLVSLSFLEGLFVSSNLVFFFVYTKIFHMSLPSYSLWEMFIFGIQIFNPVYGFIADSDFLFKGSKSGSLKLISIIGVFLYGFVAFIGDLGFSLVGYFILHFLIEFVACFRCVIIDSFAAELNNMEKYFKRMNNIRNAHKNLQFVKTTLKKNNEDSPSMMSNSDITRNMLSLSQSRLFQEKLNKIKKNKLPLSAIQVKTLSVSESLKSKQIAQKKKTNNKSNANLNTSILFGTKLVGKIISNALVGLAHDYVDVYFFLFYGCIYIVLFVYISFCIPRNSNIHSTREGRKTRIKRAHLASQEEIKDLQVKTQIRINPNISQELDEIKIHQDVLETQNLGTQNEWQKEKLWPLLKASMKLIREKKLVRLLLANATFKISPSFRSSFDFFLLHIMLFTSKEFSIQKILDSICFFMGIILLNTVFKKFDNRRFLIFNGVTYSLLIFVLIFIVYSVFQFPNIDFFLLIIIYSSFHSLFFELLFIPIAGTRFLEISINF
jgi:hypothetical protein